jgi:hypothetical protein
MYLRKFIIHNSGATDRLAIEAQFDSSGCPKPIILVGTNGSGKTGVLSTIADALIEVAAQTFHNITPHADGHRKFYRILGGRSIKSGAKYELSLIKLTHGPHGCFDLRLFACMLQSNIIRRARFFTPQPPS